MPLSAEQVATFWHSFHSFRDLALVGLMLLDGLRSCEVLSLQLEDLQLADAQMRVIGEGNKTRVLPLPREVIDVLQNYLRLERPLTLPDCNCGNVGSRRLRLINRAVIQTSSHNR